MDLLRLFEFYQLMEKLKTAMRYSTNNKYNESTAEHSWKLSMMVFVTAEELKLDIDVFHAVKIAMVHDLPELICGDVDNTLVFDGKFDESNKIDCERKAMKQISDTISDGLGIKLFNLWDEYEKAETFEAKFVKAMDKLEAISHMLFVGGEYKRLDHAVQYPDKSVSNFPELKPLLKVFKNKLKEQFLLQGLEWKPEYEYVLKNN